MRSESYGERTERSVSATPSRDATHHDVCMVAKRGLDAEGDDRLRQLEVENQAFRQQHELMLKPEALEPNVMSHYQKKGKEQSMQEQSDQDVSHWRRRRNEQKREREG